MLGGGAEVTVGFLKQLQSVLHRHLHDEQTHRQERGQSAVGLKVALNETELYSGWSWRHGWNEFNFSAIKLEVDLLENLKLKKLFSF